MQFVQEQAVRGERGNTTMVRFGRGGRTLVLLPGLSLRPLKAAGLPLAFGYRAFAKDFDVIVLDRNDVLPGPCTIEALARDAIEALDSLQVEKADVLGISRAA